MKNLSEYVPHCLFYVISSDYREHSRKQKALREQKKTVEDKLGTEQIQDLMHIQQIGSD